MKKVLLSITLIPIILLSIFHYSSIYDYVYKKISLDCYFRWEVIILDKELWKFTTINSYNPNDFFLQKHKIIITSPENLPMEWVEISGLKSRFWTSLKRYHMIDPSWIEYPSIGKYPICKKNTLLDILPFLQYPLVIPVLIFCIVYLRKLKKKK